MSGQILIRCRCLQNCWQLIKSLHADLICYFPLAPIAMQLSPAHVFHFSIQLDDRPLHFTHDPEGL